MPTLSAKNWIFPTGFRKTIPLSKGKAEVRVHYGPDIVETKVYVPFTDAHGIVLARPYKGVDGDGDHQTVKVRVRATSIRLKLPDGTVVTSRSCCKFPDDFCPIIGVNLASKRLIHGTCGGLLHEDRALIRKTLNDTAVSSYTPVVVKPLKKVAAASRKEVTIDKN